MALTYVGYRPILAGRNSNNFIGPRGNVGKYSNYSLRDTGTKVFTGFPNTNYAVGSNDRQVRILEYIYSGRQHVAPMAGAGLGPDLLTGARYKPLENKAAGGALVFQPAYGHLDRVTNYSAYSNYQYDGLDSAEPMKGPGHVLRYTTTYGGPFKPYENKGASVQAMYNPGQTIPAVYTNAYGKNRVNEWRGLPSSKALNI